ncbi:hypothetical protein LTS18_000277 [Coniosporium uncinatum]|uniref:Uncharacterized protein n=1 Tax=Coniosporium uncinatum TaxID=93489 RepID=A0ACC3DVI7_9PEZI|nr:hypothetical protein LTS18_000277 [Coniosporium uncinatum]
MGKKHKNKNRQPTELMENRVNGVVTRSQTAKLPPKPQELQETELLRQPQGYQETYPPPNPQDGRETQPFVGQQLLDFLETESTSLRGNSQENGMASERGTILNDELARVDINTSEVAVRPHARDQFRVTLQPSEPAVNRLKSEEKKGLIKHVREPGLPKPSDGAGNGIHGELQPHQPNNNSVLRPGPYLHTSFNEWKQKASLPHASYPGFIPAGRAGPRPPNHGQNLSMWCAPAPTSSQALVTPTDAGSMHVGHNVDLYRTHHAAPTPPADHLNKLHLRPLHQTSVTLRPSRAHRDSATAPQQALDRVNNVEKSARNAAQKPNANLQAADTTDRPRRSHTRSPLPLPVPMPTQAYVLRALEEACRVPRPRSLLIILDLNGTILHRPDRKRNVKFEARPHCKEFLDYLLRNHRLMIWSSARPENVSGMCDQLFTPEQRRLLVAEWGRNTLGLSRQQYEAKTQVYKQLKFVWNNPDVQRTHPGIGRGGKWDQGNTVLVDDSVVKAAADPFNLLQIPEFEGRREQTQTDTLGMVVGYLEELRGWGDVSAFMRVRKFGVDAGWGWDWDAVVGGMEHQNGEAGADIEADAETGEQSGEGYVDEDNLP